MKINYKRLTENYKYISLISRCSVIFTSQKIGKTLKTLLTDFEKLNTATYPYRFFFINEYHLY